MQTKPFRRSASASRKLVLVFSRLRLLDRGSLTVNRCNQPIRILKRTISNTAIAGVRHVRTVSIVRGVFAGCNKVPSPSDHAAALVAVK